jgi:branched-chain amino acid transport system permease protein
MTDVTTDSAPRASRWAPEDATRYAARGIAGAAAIFVLAWVLFWAPKTTYGSAVSDPSDFFKTFLDSITFAGLLFVVASGFTLIFGLMRVVNMAQGSFFLLGGFIAYKLQQNFAHGGGFGLLSSQVSLWQWVLPAIIAAGCVAIVGLAIQQAFLRWNQGQDLRQALITIAISIILADQLLAHFNAGNAQSISWPGKLDRFISLGFGGIQYSLARLFMLAVAVVVGVLLWLWLQKTRTGMVIRAGVDDRQMVSGLGVNIQLTFALAFFVGAALAGFGGVMGGSFAGLQIDVGGQWLLNCLVVVIIGGMGSLAGAAVGAILYAFVFNFSAIYLPTTSNNCCTEYSVVFTFALLALVLAFRPQGLLGRPG